ncbi:hypothetical protein ABIE44_000166 [Marmoricola sp. OAE513]|uniref:hypothetical protein n=1 Tax=Marmoricola sp. OAE513 TaxID=2817894 RepID=UPI001AE83743
MDDLGAALRELAGQAVAPSVNDPAGLWKQGRARVRRRRLAAVGVAAVLLGVLAGLGTYVAVPTASVVPVQSPHAPAVPKNVWQGPDWLPSTADEGPVGTVAALGVRRDKYSEGRFVVSARTGEYRLLELPGYRALYAESHLQLSPDGNHIAYWYFDKAGMKSERALPKGAAVYDTRTGDVVRWPYPYATDPKFSPYSVRSLLWIDRGHLALFGASDGPGEGYEDRTFVWDIGMSTPELLNFEFPSVGNVGPPNLDGRILGKTVPLDDDRHYGFIAGSGRLTPGSTVTLPPSDGEYDYTEPTRQGSLVVVNHFGFDRRVLVGEADRRGVVKRVSPIAGLAGAEVLGWLDAKHVLSLTHPAGAGEHQLSITDLATGMTKKVGSAEGAGGEDYKNPDGSPFFQVATDLLGEPLVEGVHPPSLDPRLRIAGLVAGGVVLFVALAAGAWAQRRRRV